VKKADDFLAELGLNDIQEKCHITHILENLH
jgi:hypothetical protein